MHWQVSHAARRSAGASARLWSVLAYSAVLLMMFLKYSSSFMRWSVYDWAMPKSSPLPMAEGECRFKG